MPPHTTLQYTMPSNPTNSKPTATTNGTTQMNTNSKPVTPSTTTKVTSRQRRATSASSYIFAPSWLINLNNSNKAGPSSTPLSPAYASTTECPSTKEENKGLGSSKKDGLGGIKQVKDCQEKDGNSSINRTSVVGTSPLTPIRSRASSRSTASEVDGIETVMKGFHGRSRSASQAGSTISSSPTSFDRNFPTLAKKKQFSLSVDLSASNVDNMWKNSDTKSKLLSPTSTPMTEETIHNPIMDNEPELERRMSLVPKVESGKLDGKRIKNSVKRKTSRSLSMDSASRGPTNNSGFGITGNRTLGQTQHLRFNLKENVATKIQGSRVASITTPNGKKATPRIGNGQTLTGRKLSISGGSKFIWSNNTMGKMGYFKMMSDDDERVSGDRKEENDQDHIEEEEEEGNEVNTEVEKEDSEEEGNEDNIEVEKKESNLPQIQAGKLETCTDVTTVKSLVDEFDKPLSSSPNSVSLEREESFLRQLGWQKPYDKDADCNKWAITEEEKRLFINLVRSLNGVSITGTNDVLSNGEIDRAKRKWAALNASQTT